MRLSAPAVVPVYGEMFCDSRIPSGAAMVVAFVSNQQWKDAWWLKKRMWYARKYCVGAVCCQEEEEEMEPKVV